MMKKESHDLLTLIKQSSIDCYDPENSILLCDDSFDELYGLLMSLSAIDVEFCLKNDSTDLRARDSYICWFLSPSYLAIDLEVDAGNVEISSPEKDQALVNQKSYLEQENVLLHNKVSAKNSRIDELEKQLATANTMNIAIEASLEKFKIDVEDHQGAKDLAREEIDSVKDLLTNETELKVRLETELNEKTSQVNDLVMALKILERDVSDKRETVQDLNSKNSDLKAVKDELYENYQSEKTSASQLMVSNDELRSGLTRLRKTLENVENDHEKLEASFDLKTKQAASLKGQVEQLGKARDAVSSDLEVERDWRQKLQSELNKHKDLSKQIVERSSKIEELKAKLGVQKEEKQEAFTRITELEQSLSELGQKFEDQVVTAEEVRDYVANSVGKGGTWVSDELVSFCKGCDSKFTIARRRHHCRRCGDIFCAKCSSSTKKLTDSSSKAVRVCDICVVELA
jgi:chromosome segregation ATPase